MKCQQRGCENEATHRMFWPGREPSPICESHLAWDKNICENGLGMYLHSEGLSKESRDAEAEKP